MTPTVDTRGLTGIREQFPVLDRVIGGRSLAYLDSGASAQKPEAVLRALEDFNRNHHANVHRGAHTLSQEATDAFEGARRSIAAHLNARPPEVIFTGNATDAINLVARTWGRDNLGPGDRIVLTEMEHHSNIVPWQLAAAETGAEIDWVGVDESGHLIEAELDAALSREPRMIALTHVSNVLGTINPVADIASRARAAGALVLVDGAQAAPKLELDMAAIGADFYAFTGHKLYGPTGVGVLWGRAEVLEAMSPYRGGGSMIRKVTKQGSTWADPPARFEAGTPPIAQAVGLGAAYDWLAGVGIDAVHQHELELTGYAIDRLGEVPGLRLYGPPAGPDRAGILSFTLEGVHPHDVAEILDRHGVGVRAGHHCAQILMDRLGITGTTRASLAAYNTADDIDGLIDGLHDVRRIFGD